MEQEHAAIYSKVEGAERGGRGGVGGSECFRAKYGVVMPRVLLDMCQEQSELSCLCEVCTRYIFHKQEDMGITEGTGHRARGTGHRKVSCILLLNTKYQTNINIVLMHMSIEKIKRKKEYNLYVTF